MPPTPRGRPPDGPPFANPIVRPDILPTKLNSALCTSALSTSAISWTKLVLNAVGFEQIWPNFEDMFSTLVKIGVTPAMHWPASAKIGRVRPNLVRVRANLGPVWSNFGPISADFDQVWGTSAEFGIIPANLAMHDLTWTISVTFARCRPNLARVRKHVGQIWHAFDHSLDRFGRFGPDSGRRRCI